MSNEKNLSGLHLFTLPETNIAPENGWLEYYFPIGMAYFQVRTVSFREGRVYSYESKTAKTAHTYQDRQKISTILPFLESIFHS